METASPTPTPPEDGAKIVPVELQDLPFDTMIETDRYNGSIYIRNTRLMDIIARLSTYMNDVNRNAIKDILDKHTSYSKVARSYHQQALNLVKRYIPLYRKMLDPAIPASEDVPKSPMMDSIGMKKIELAVMESELILSEANKRADEEREKRSQGNVKFSKVKSKR